MQRAAPRATRSRSNISLEWPRGARNVGTIRGNAMKARVTEANGSTAARDAAYEAWRRNPRFHGTTDQAADVVAEVGDRRTRRLLTATDVAERLSVSRAAVYRGVREGRLDGVRVGRQLRFSLESVESYISQQVGSEALGSHGERRGNTPTQAEWRIEADIAEMIAEGALKPVPDDWEFVVTQVVAPGIELGFSRVRSGACRYPGHRDSDWTADGGRQLCGICHPPPGQAAVASL